MSDFVVGTQFRGARSYQEDSFRIELVRDQAGDATHLLCVLADGMGGHAGGDVASQLAVDVFIDHFKGADGETPARLHGALRAANQAIAEKIDETDHLRDMGCTLVGVSICGNEMHWVSVGDSPLWLNRAGRLNQINEDHSMAPVIQGLVELGRLSPEAAAVDPRRNQLRSAVIGEELTLVDLTEKPLELLESDLVIIASDGMQTISDRDIEQITTDHSGTDLEDMMKQLVVAVEARKKPEQDNTTLILYRHVPGAIQVYAGELDAEADTVKKSPLE